MKCQSLNVSVTFFLMNSVELKLDLSHSFCVRYMIPQHSLVSVPSHPETKNINVTGDL